MGQTGLGAKENITQQSNNYDKATLYMPISPAGLALKLSGESAQLTSYAWQMPMPWAGPEYAFGKC